MLDVSGQPVVVGSETGLTIAPDGTVSVDGRAVSRLAVVSLSDATKEGESLFTGTPAAASPTTQVRQGYLEASGVDAEGLQRDAQAEADRVAAELRAAITTLADPAPLTVFDHVYAEPNSHLDRQRDRYARYLAMFDEAGTEASGREGGVR